METDFLECPICTDIFTKVVETTCCHRCYCKSCLSDWINKMKNCPSCRSLLESVDNCSPNVPIQRAIDNLPGTCPYVSIGCKDKITRGIVEEHIKICDYSPYVCEWGNENCPKLLRKEKIDHQQKCSFRPINCINCGALVKFNETENHIALTCPNAEIKCVNEKCSMLIIRSQLQKHLESCDYQTVSCLFKTFGCSDEFHRIDTENHNIQESNSHLKLVTARAKFLEKENGYLRDLVSSLESDLKVSKDNLDSFSETKPDLPFSNLSKLPVFLPHKMSKTIHKDIIITSQDKLTVGTRSSGGFSSFGFSTKSKVIPAIVRSNTIIPNIVKFNQPYYFEITIKKYSSNGQIMIGLVEQFHPMTGSLGEISSIGFDITTFELHCNNKQINMSLPYGETIRDLYPESNYNGYTIGCGWDPKDGAIFFTAEGTCLGTAITNIEGKFYPAICLNGVGIEVNINFGKKRFLWDTTRYWETFREMEKKIQNCLAQKICTYHVTSSDFFLQVSYQCYTCNLISPEAICEVCAKICHAGHKLSPPKCGILFCDCGPKKNMCICLPD